MRIGVAGTHGVGKSTLVADLAALLPDHVGVDEPYLLLESQGYAFDEPPSAHDFAVQLGASLRLLGRPALRVVFDRTPLDFVAYLRAVGAEPEVDVDQLRAAVSSLDLLVVLPITPETERRLPRPEARRLQLGMNDALLDLVASDHDDVLGDVRVLELDGPVDRRAADVTAALAHGAE